MNSILPQCVFRLAVMTTLGVLLSGCQNPWKDFYQGNALPENAPYSGKPTCVAVQEFDPVIQEYIRNDFIPMGRTTFNAGNNVRLDDLQSFGESIKADVILYAVGNRTQTQSAMVVPQYNPGSQQTTYLSGYGSNGSSFYGTANTYNSGTYSSTVVPVTVVRQDYAAFFLKKNWQKRILGIMPRDLTPDEIRKVGTNSAIYIGLIVRGTPAFLADLFEGDIILEVNGMTPMAFWSSIDNFKGKEVKFVILRNDQKITKTVRLGTGI